MFQDENPPFPKQCFRKGTKEINFKHFQSLGVNWSFEQSNWHLVCWLVTIAFCVGFNIIGNVLSDAWKKVSGVYLVIRDLPVIIIGCSNIMILMPNSLSFFNGNYELLAKFSSLSLLSKRSIIFYASESVKCSLRIPLDFLVGISLEIVSISQSVFSFRYVRCDNMSASTLALPIVDSILILYDWIFKAHLCEISWRSLYVQKPFKKLMIYRNDSFLIFTVPTELF